MNRSLIFNSFATGLVVSLPVVIVSLGLQRIGTEPMFVVLFLLVPVFVFAVWSTLVFHGLLSNALLTTVFAIGLGIGSSLVELSARTDWSLSLLALVIQSLVPIIITATIACLS